MVGCKKNQPKSKRPSPSIGGNEKKDQNKTFCNVARFSFIFYLNKSLKIDGRDGELGTKEGGVYPLIKIIENLTDR